MAYLVKKHDRYYWYRSERVDNQVRSIYMGPASAKDVREHMQNTKRHGNPAKGHNPISRTGEGKYKHSRRTSPDNIVPNTYKTVPISHVKTRKKYPKGTMAITGKSKKTGKWITQSVLIPKD